MRTRQKWDSETERAAKCLDALTEYDEFCRNILPKLRRMVQENWPPERIRRTFGSYIQAQVITSAFRGDFRAIKDTLDRHEGTAAKRAKNVHHHTKMGKTELAALAYQKLKDAGLILPADADVGTCHRKERKKAKSEIGSQGEDVKPDQESLAPKLGSKTQVRDEL